MTAKQVALLLLGYFLASVAQVAWGLWVLRRRETAQPQHSPDLEVANSRLHAAYELIASMKREGFASPPLSQAVAPAPKLPLAIRDAIASVQGSPEETADLTALAWRLLEGVQEHDRPEAERNIVSRILRGADVPSEGVL